MNAGERRRRGFRMLIRTCLIFLFACSCLEAQEPADVPRVLAPEKSKCGGTHRPGDTLTCVVVFDGDPEFDKVEVVFNLPENPPPNHRGSYINFVLRISRKVAPGTYEVSDVLPDCVPGEYILAAVSAGITGKGYRLYSNGYGFHSQLTVDFENDPKEFDNPVNDKLEAEGGTSPILTLPEALDPSLFPPVTGILKLAAPEDLSEREKTVSGEPHQPGDKITVRVTFDGDTNFNSVILNFNMQTPVPEDQLGLCNGFLLDKTKLIDAQTYEVTGVLQACASGRYFVSDITVFAPAGRSHLYKLGAEFKSRFVLDLHNEHQTLFPNVKLVGSTP